MDLLNEVRATNGDRRRRPPVRLPRAFDLAMHTDDPWYSSDHFCIASASFFPRGAPHVATTPAATLRPAWANRSRSRMSVRTSSWIATSSRPSTLVHFALPSGPVLGAVGKVSGISAFTDFPRVDSRNTRWMCTGLRSHLTSTSNGRTVSWPRGRPLSVACREGRGCRSPG
jgi:hypothetical protein